MKAAIAASTLLLLSLPATSDAGAKSDHVAKLSVGGSQACALTAKGRLYCWGSGYKGQLGYGSTEDIGDDELPRSAGPIDLGPGLRATQVAAGGGFTCAILQRGRVKCWGDGTFGELGYANTEDIGDDETPADVGTIDLGPGRSAVQIATGTTHTCALLDDASVRCWGSNYYGELGYGNTDNVGDDETPGEAGPVNLGPGVKATSVIAGENFSCVTTQARDVMCWGLANFGRLGYGQNGMDVIGDDEDPAAAGTLNLGVGQQANQLSTTYYHSCALLDTARIRCWGGGGYGQLGYASTESIGDDETPDTAGPVKLGEKARAVAAGGYFTCAIMADRSVRCWGKADWGELGSGDTLNVGDDEYPRVAAPVDLGAGRTARAVATGDAVTCVVLDNRRVKCWGLGDQGVLGYGNTETIGDDETPASVGFVKILPKSS